VAKRWVAEGNHVTLFCGNDGKNPRYESIDGVNIIRRGGFFFVYVWAALYYLLKLRGKFDVIIDSENGIPFFTPLYAKEKKYLLIYHVHGVVFKKSLSPPLAMLANFLETKAMPKIYNNVQVITISESSKLEILANYLTNKEPIVVYGGIDPTMFKPGEKQSNPLVLYLGRLKDHKSIPVFIYTAKEILKSHAEVEFVIAGDGPDKKTLLDLVKKLDLVEKIKFVGRVSEEVKVALYQQAWVFMNPSLMEGWGITSIEANACGTSVVASDVPGLRESIQNPHTGYLVPYGNVGLFTDRINYLIENGSFRRTIEKNARKWALNFDWDKSAKQWLDIFNNHDN
jgi:glycosyltransferase involved in cell wall biosynthesis